MISPKSILKPHTPKPHPDAPAKYKTEICRNWQSGHCAFATKCTFAHGARELRVRKYVKSRPALPYTDSLVNYVEGERGGRRLPVFEELANR